MGVHRTKKKPRWLLFCVVIMVVAKIDSELQRWKQQCKQQCRWSCCEYRLVVCSIWCVFSIAGAEFLSVQFLRQFTRWNDSIADWLRLLVVVVLLTRYNSVAYRIEYHSTVMWWLVSNDTTPFFCCWLWLALDQLALDLLVSIILFLVVATIHCLQARFAASLVAARMVPIDRFFFPKARPTEYR